MELEMEFIRKLPSPQELKMEHPVDPGLYQIKTRRDQEIRDILEQWLHSRVGKWGTTTS